MAAPHDCLLQCPLTQDLSTTCINDPCRALAEGWECCHQSNIRVAFISAVVLALLFMIVLFLAKVVNVYSRRGAASKQGQQTTGVTKMTY